MKYLKIIGLAALAAMALTAFGVSSASAATVCSTEGHGSACKAGHGNQYTGEIHAVNVGNVILTATSSEGKTVNTVTSTSSTVQGTISDSESGAGSISIMSFAGLSSTLCSSVSATTTASSTNPWPSSVTTDGPSETTNGIMTTSNVTGSFTCSFLGALVTCKYFTSNAQTTVDGSDTDPLVTAESIPLSWEQGPTSVCGSKADWTGTYTITTPKSLFIE
ncbi:MAG TPA: hypothetical protein VEP91_01245 [Solirubrobacterales bacterium]|nr:hypothetical protein [Solirubrobacterales bacterium]